MPSVEVADPGNAAVNRPRRQFTTGGGSMVQFVAEKNETSDVSGDDNSRDQLEIYNVGVRLVTNQGVAATVDAPPSEPLLQTSNERWAAIGNFRDLNEAINLARVYADQKARVVSAQNGWFVVVLGPYAASRLSTFRKSYRGPKLPGTVQLTRGSSYVATVWPAPPEALVQDNSAPPTQQPATSVASDRAKAAYDRGDYATALMLWKQSPLPADTVGASQSDQASPLADNLALSGDQRWVAIASVDDVDQAIKMAGDFAQQKSRVVKAQNGWFVVVLGPYPTSRISDFRKSYTGPPLPPGIMLTRGTGYVATVWPDPIKPNVQPPESVDETPTAAVSPVESPPSPVAPASPAQLKLLAEEGDANAQNNLGTAYAQGEGVPQDYVMAHMWFNLAAAQGQQDAQLNRDNIAKLMTPDQVADAQRLAREWKPKTEP